MSALEHPPVTTAGAAAAPSAEPTMDGILRFLRVNLHVGFALLLAVAVVQLMTSSPGRPARYIFLALALILAAVYLLGTVAEKRFAAGALARNPGRYALAWLGLVTVLWAVLLAGSASFSWLVFPLFFLHLHFLPRWVGFAAVAVMTLAVIGAQWAAAGALPLAAVLGPVFGAAFAVVTSMAYGWHAKSTTPWRRVFPASSWSPGRPKSPWRPVTSPPRRKASPWSGPRRRRTWLRPAPLSAS
jgi:MFS family permease